MDQRGALSVIRQGFRFHGQQIRLAYFAPGHNLNPAVWDLYKKNRLSGGASASLRPQERQ